VGKAVATASRLSHLGSGSVIGGRVSLLVDKNLLEELSASRDVALVSATNGKTTTTRLLSAALGSNRSVVSNALGANMPPGHVAALADGDPNATAVLEVDERWLGTVMAATRPSTVVLLNLSRDQLDRSHEVRNLAARWRTSLSTTPADVTVANADDPLVAWAAMASPHVVWVAAGSSWTADAVGCPQCGGRLAFPPDGPWYCTHCTLVRPTIDVDLDGEEVVLRDGSRVRLGLALPGRVNRMNAAIALAAAVEMGAEPTAAAEAMGAITDVAGRYRKVTRNGATLRLLLAKNPAGWHEAIDMLEPAPQPVIVAINARIADGHDPSWLWDVQFERLAGRLVVATGQRRLDLAVRLRYAGVEHVVADDLDDAIRASGASKLDVAANYTAFQEYLEMLT
jgi:UDP-N-acetylmuramyl tripeptide synthase